MNRSAREHPLTARKEVRERDERFPTSFLRDYEDRLLDLAATGELDPKVWRSLGAEFFMAGLAVMLASARGFDREAYLALAEALYPGATAPEVFARWLEKTPLRPSRFLPRARRRKAYASSARSAGP